VAAAAARRPPDPRLIVLAFAPALPVVSCGAVAADTRLVSERFPRASRYNPDWLIASMSGGANSLWLAEWLSEVVDLRPGMRILDLGCGRAAQSIFLAREFGAQVWAADLWFSADENQRRIDDAGTGDRVTALHADARALPFAAGFFDAILCIDSFQYYATDDFFLSNIARFVKPCGVLALAGACLLQEIDGEVPEHLAAWWEPPMFSLHSPAWWRRHWEKTRLVTIERAEAMPDGWRRWLDWQRVICPGNALEIQTVETDAGRWIGYLRLVARRAQDAIDPPVLSVPTEYRAVSLRRGE
jgi:SAM-dependent methyltransferase